MLETTSFKRLILREVLRQVSPMVIRLVSVSDQMQPPDFHEIFRAVLGWNGDLATSFASTCKSSTASAGKRDPKPCTNSSCTAGKVALAREHRGSARAVGQRT